MSDINTPAVLSTPAFRQAYEQLNARQRAAVDNLEFPLMIVAGPGTGKTQVLTMRIANLLHKTDADPSTILALTFTDSAAKNMRDRLAQLIGPTAYYVNICTFHSFCSDVIRSYPEYFSIARNSEPLTQLERFEIIEQLIKGTQLEVIKPLNTPLHYLKEILSGISNLKREGINCDQFEKILEEEEKFINQNEAEFKPAEFQQKKRNLIKQTELLQLYRLYQQELRERKRYDFDDMIMLVVEAFQEHELLLRLHQERLQYFLVDEYQDTNSAQNKVVDLLASYWQDKANICVVGDPHQAIFRFQGASIENMLGFVDRYQTAEVVSLNQGYRCTQKIYNIAHSLINNNHSHQQDNQDNPTKEELFKLLSQPLSSQVDQEIQASFPDPVKTFSIPTQTLESIFVARRIKQLIDSGVSPEEIAVLYRYNSDSIEVAEALSKWGIRYEIEGGDDILQSEFTNQLLNFFQVMLDLRRTQEDQLVYQVLHYPWFEMDQLLVMKLGRIAGKMRLSLLEVIDRGYDAIVEAKLQAVLSEEEFLKIKVIVDQLYYWSGLDHNELFTHWFEIVLKEAKIFDWLQAQPNYAQLLNELNSLYRQVKSMVSGDRQFKLANFLEALRVMREHQLQITAEDLNITKGAVSLSTVHKAKGREWEHVFVTQLNDKKWGNRQSREILPLPEGILEHTKLSDKEKNEDERRSFYVALTRAKHSVTLSYPETIVSDNRSDSKNASLFLAELGDQVEVSQDEQLILEADSLLQKMIEPIVSAQPSIDQQQFFQLVLKDFRLSVTALNTYLRDPKEFLENNLLRLPRAKEAYMAYGTAVHEALEKLYTYFISNQKMPDEAFLLDQFEQSLTKELLTEDDFARRLQHGKDILSNYYQCCLDDTPNVIQVERSVGYGWSKAVIDSDIELTGKIDRLDWIDQEKKLVRVVDYKTGKPKSENFIRGAIKSCDLSAREQSLPETIRGPYMRQLVFYKLLCQLDRTFTGTVTHGMFDFVEPAKKGSDKLVTRELEITDEAVDDLKQLIRQVMKEIRNLEFLKA
jgi:DNA helicase II / ATP-dependent DNA helicase PcrA